MSFSNPQYRIPRRSVEQPRGQVGMWAKFPPMTDKEDPPTPEFLNLTNPPVVGGIRPRANPVPEIMRAAGFQNSVIAPHTVNRDLMHGMTIDTWDGKKLTFFLFRDQDNVIASASTYPAATIRVPRGALFHGQTHGHGPPPHTIHWHGIEPTPMNDGVGHCSMEIGDYTYQWQPNFIGHYFYHCHRNTVQHFEFGLFGLLLIHPPDAFYASIANLNADGSVPETVTLNTVPIGAGRDGKFRTAANLVTPIGDFREGGAGNPFGLVFPGFVGGDPVNGVFVPDPWTGDSGLKFPTDPHAFTVPYDVEALWVLDDRDSTWSEFAPDARAFFPDLSNRPGLDDGFKQGFFNDYNADYWFVTGVPVPAARGGTATIQPAAPPPLGGIGGIDINPGGTNPLGLIPPALNSGVAGTQIAITAQVNQTILIRVLDAAYNVVRVTFPFDVLIHAFDGRALGVPPFGLYNHAFVLPANVPFLLCTARRFDALMRPNAAGNFFATVEFYDSQGATSTGGGSNRPVPLGPKLVTARIPINISGVVPPPTPFTATAQFNPRNRRLTVRTNPAQANAPLQVFAGSTLLLSATLDRRGRFSGRIPGTAIPTHVLISGFQFPVT